MSNFQYIKPSEEQVAKMQNFRDKFQALHDEIQQSCTPSRGVSLALTKLEESAFWLNKSITQND